jgi:hypothetical protein
MNSIRIVAVSVAVTALLAACGPNEAKGDSATVAAGGSDAAVAATDHGRSPAVAANGVAAGMPAFAPQYPQGTTATSYAAAQNGSHGGVYAFTTTDPAERVFDFYRSKAEAAGLATQTNIETAGSRIYAAQGPAGDLAVAAAPRGDGKTYVQVTWSAKG